MPRTVSVYYFSANDDEEEPTFKERFLENMMRFIDIMCVWDCCWLWLQLQKYVGLLVFDPFVELFITLCIVVNTLFMALDHHDMNKDLERALKSGNYVSRYNVSKQILHPPSRSAQTRVWDTLKNRSIPEFYKTSWQVLIITFTFLPIVLHSNILDWSITKVDRHESKVLLSRRMEYFRFYHSDFIPFGAGFGRCSGFVSVAVFQIGELVVQNILYFYKCIREAGA